MSNLAADAKPGVSPSRRRTLSKMLGKMFDRLVIYEQEAYDHSDTELEESICCARIAVGVAWHTSGKEA